MAQITGTGQEKLVCRLRAPQTDDEERALLERTVPKNTLRNTKWALKVLEEWQRGRTDKHPNKLSPVCRLRRFIEEVCNRSGQRYPARTLYRLVCGIKRYLSDINGFENQR